MGAQDILVQRILRHLKAHVTRDCYIKVFDDAVIAAMDKLQVQTEELEQTERHNDHQLEFAFADSLDQRIAVRESPTRGGFSDFVGGSPSWPGGALLAFIFEGILGCAAKEQQSSRAVVVSC